MPHSQDRDARHERMYPQLAPLGATITFTAAPLSSSIPVLFRCDSADAIQFLCPILGPTCTLLLNRITSWLDVTTDGMPLTVDPASVGATLGIGMKPLTASLERLVRFEMATRPAPDTLSVITDVQRFPARWLPALPDHIRAALMDWQRTLSNRSLR